VHAWLAPAAWEQPIELGVAVVLEHVGLLRRLEHVGLLRRQQL